LRLVWIQNLFGRDAASGNHILGRSGFCQSHHRAISVLAFHTAGALKQVSQLCWVEKIKSYHRRYWDFPGHGPNAGRW
jgi:hypothetical protein